MEQITGGIIKTLYSKGRDGWKGETRIGLGGDRYLDISTWKSSRGGLVTSATVCKSKDGVQTHAIGFGVCGDYSKRLADDRGVRCTEKSVRAQHERCIAEAAAITADAKAWYANGLDIHPDSRAKVLAARAAEAA